MGVPIDSRRKYAFLSDQEDWYEGCRRPLKIRSRGSRMVFTPPSWRFRSSPSCLASLMA
ncbi:hypothetical protein BC567DRAFT_83214 [Phyllosticta citribraziliensis]